MLYTREQMRASIGHCATINTTDRNGKFVETVVRIESYSAVVNGNSGIEYIAYGRDRSGKEHQFAAHMIVELDETMPNEAWVDEKFTDNLRQMAEL